MGGKLRLVHLTFRAIAQPGGGSSNGPFGTPERVKSFAGAVECSLTSLTSVQAVPLRPMLAKKVAKCPPWCQAVGLGRILNHEASQRSKARQLGADGQRGRAAVRRRRPR